MREGLNLYKEYKVLDLNSRHTNRLFELTELHINWFKKFYPNSNNNNFSFLLRINHAKLSSYVVLDLMGKYDSDLIDSKFDKMFEAYHSLFEISELNRLHGNVIDNRYNRDGNEIIINNIKI